MFGHGFLKVITVMLALQPKAAEPAPEAKKAPAAAEAKVSADDVVTGVQGYYKATEKMSATFRQTYTNTVFGKTSKSDGTVFIMKPGKMAWKYSKPDVKHYITDGSKLWVIEENNKQAFVKNLEDEVLPVAVTFLAGQGDLKKDFTASLDPGKYGAKGDLVLKLVPKTPSAQYKTLWLVVDPADFHVKESIIEEASGNFNQFKFSNIKLNKDTKVADKNFQVSEAALKKKGIKIIKPQEQKPGAAGGSDNKKPQ